MKRSILLPLLATAATLSIVTHALEAAEAPPPTRLASAIREEVAARDKALADRARAIELRERAARAIEQRMVVAPAPEGAAAPASGRTAAGGQAPEPYESLATIYQAMKPAKAAAVLERLELPVQVEITSRMRERSAALIMAQMQPDAAATLSMALARKPAGQAAAPAAQPKVASRS
jgi:flagellar motility protein MotE (MotC chaperone)